MENSTEIHVKTRSKTTKWPSICPKKTMIQKVMCTLVFNAALFTIARTWKQPRCQSTEEWMKVLWHIHIMKNNSTNKKEQI